MLVRSNKAISELYKHGEVKNTRDETTPVRFVEAIQSVGEWKGMHSTKHIQSIIWRYHHEDQWYICKQNDDALKEEDLDSKSNDIVETQIIKLQRSEKRRGGKEARLRAAPAAQQAGFGKVEQHPCPPSSLVSGAIIIGAAAGPCPADIGQSRVGHGWKSGKPSSSGFTYF